MAYLNCPTCRLTVYSPTTSATSEECPRCRAKLGKVSRLFRSRFRRGSRRGPAGPGERARETAPAP